MGAGVGVGLGVGADAVIGTGLDADVAVACDDPPSPQRVNAGNAIMHPNALARACLLVVDMAPASPFRYGCRIA